MLAAGDQPTSAMRGRAREDHVFGTILGADVLGPQVRLHTENVRALRIGQRSRRGIEAIDVLDAHDRPAAGTRPIERTVVEIERRRRRQHRVVIRGGRRDCAFDAAPGHDRGVRREPAFEDFVPADQAPAVLVEILADALHEVALQLVLILHAELAHPAAHARRSAPLVLHGLIAAGMDVLAREQRQHLAEHVFEERERRLLDVEQVLIDAPVGRNGSRLARDAELRIRGNRRARMARHIDLGHDRDVAGRCVRDDLADLVLGIETAVEPRPSRGRIDVGCRSRTRRHAPGADFSQLRILLDLDAPSLIVRQVPLQHVELVQRHRVDEPLDELRRLVVTRRVQQQAAPAKARRIVDLSARECSMTPRRAATTSPHRRKGREGSARQRRFAWGTQSANTPLPRPGRPRGPGAKTRSSARRPRPPPPTTPCRGFAA